MYSVLVVYCYKLEHQHGHWVLGNHLVLCEKHSLTCRVSRCGNNALENVSSVTCIFMSRRQH